LLPPLQPNAQAEEIYMMDPSVVVPPRYDTNPVKSLSKALRNKKIGRPTDIRSVAENFG